MALSVQWHFKKVFIETRLLKYSHKNTPFRVGRSFRSWGLNLFSIAQKEGGCPRALTSNRFCGGFPGEGGLKGFDLPSGGCVRFNSQKSEVFLVFFFFFFLFQVTYKWLSYTLKVHVNQAKQ